MSLETFLLFVVGLVLGWVIAQMSIMFFEREIFAFLDWLVAKVRSACRLKP